MRRKPLLFWCAICCIFLASCIAPVSTPTPIAPISASTPTQMPDFTAAPTKTRTLTATLPAPSDTPQAPTATITASPEPTAESTPTAFAPLADNGPYLAYMMKTSTGQALVLLNADASGGQVIPLPAGAFVAGIEGSLSPDGRWLAFFSGTAQEPPYNLSLHIMDVRQGSSQTITRLLGADYPENFTVLAETLRRDEPESYPAAYYSFEELVSGLQELFLSGIFSLEWSPDSQSLAFVAQLDGISSDIYRLDIQDPLRLVRLTSGNTQVVGLSWSANGRWIAHGATNSLLGQGWAADLYVVNRDGLAKKLDERRHFGGWLQPNYLIHYQAQNGPGKYDLHIVEIDSLITRYSRAGSYSALALDPIANQIAMYCTVFFFPDEPPGMCLYDQRGRITIAPAADFYPDEITFLGADPARYLMGGDWVDSVRWMNAQGELGVFTPKPGWIEVSPDRQWVLHYQSYLSGRSPAVMLLDAQGQEHGLIARIFPRSIFWRPDSQGVFLLDEDGQLFYSDLTATPKRVGEQVVGQWYLYWGPAKAAAIWVNP